MLKVFGLIAFICELSNLNCHRILRDLRYGPDGKVNIYKRGVPEGCGFSSVMCANYMWEILGWINFTVATKSWVCGIFTLFGASIMYVWAANKKNAY